MEIWNGSTWSVTPSPNVGTGLGNYMYGVSCVAATSCAAVGSYYTNSASLAIPERGLHLERQRWTTATPADYAYSAPKAGQQAVSCVSDWACMSVGYATNASGTFSYNTMSPMARSGYRFVGVRRRGLQLRHRRTLLGLARRHAPQRADRRHRRSCPPVTATTWSRSDGGVFAYGSAQFYGSMGGTHLNKPVVGIAVTPDGAGYWLVASDGGVFAFGDAIFYGSAGSLTLNKPVVGIASTPNGRGYWIVASDGGIFNYGPAAAFLGSTGGTTLNKPVVGIGATTAGPVLPGRLRRRHLRLPRRARPVRPSTARRAARSSTSRSSG